MKNACRIPIPKRNSLFPIDPIGYLHIHHHSQVALDRNLDRKRRSSGSMSGAAGAGGGDQLDLKIAVRFLGKRRRNASSTNETLQDGKAGLQIPRKRRVFKCGRLDLGGTRILIGKARRGT